MRKIKKLSSIIIFIIAAVVSVAIFTFFLVLFMKSYHIPKNIYASSDILSILSLNVGILQTLVAVITLGIGLIAFFNFLSMKKEFKRFKRSVRKQVKNIRKNTNKETTKKELEKIKEETNKLEKNNKGEEVKDVF